MHRLRYVSVRPLGFTLLELLVVLTLIALVMGAVLPATMRWIDAARERGWREDVGAVLRGLPLRAFGAGESMAFDEVALRVLLPDLPRAVELRVRQPLRYTAIGSALGGEVIAVKTGATEPTARWKIEPISGRVEN